MTNDPVTIRQARPSEREVALGLAMAELDDRQRSIVVDGLVPLARQGFDPFQALLVLTAGDRPAAAAWVQPQAGRVGTLWVNAHESVSPSAVASLAAKSLAAAQSYQLGMVQVLAEPTDQQRESWLVGAGVTRLARLGYFEWFAEWPLPEIAGAALQFVPRAADDLDHLADLLRRTYVETRDCPPLGGLRSMSDTIEGYQTVGDYDPDLWFAVRSGEHDIGVLLLTPYDDLQQWELTYMGVVPEQRGQGLGRPIVAHAQRLLRTAGVDRMVLAADKANAPAIAMYREQRFRHWADRVAWYAVPDRKS